MKDFAHSLKSSPNRQLTPQNFRRHDEELLAMMGSNIAQAHIERSGHKERHLVAKH